ncbi:hypothetical protein KI688_004455 [Linnemannia hyalina]|uniref:Uncharacterized protein n=1 Tax=Linnemannia hyalina TaxID=64524 RepID=A0A9P7XLK1_9FUNG|nr:hypothetical protein KI688_004455 [Linnemannia hyalina]
MEMIVSNAVMPPRNLLPSYSLAADPQAFVNDTVSVNPSEAPLEPIDETSAHDPIEHSSSSSSSCSSAEGRLAGHALAPRACMEEDEEGEKEEGAMKEFDFEYTLTASEGPFLSYPATSKEGEEDLFDAEDYPVPQVNLPKYDPNDPLWIYIDTWLKTPELPDPFVHVLAQYHQSLETYLNTILAPPPPQEEADNNADSSSRHDSVPLGEDPNTQGPTTLHGPATPAPMTEDVDDLFRIPTRPGLWSALWVMGDDDDDDEVPDLRDGSAQVH